MNRFGRNFISKVYIDSRLKRIESNSDSDFWVELPETLEMEQNVGMIITDITIPSTWYNINTNNNNFYFRSFVPGQELVAYNDFVITLEPQNYNLTELANALHALMNIAAGGEVYTVNERAQTGDIQFGSFQANLRTRILNDDELKTRVGGTWNGGYYDMNNLRTLNSMLRINNLNNDARSIQFPINTVRTGLVDLNPIHNVYITSTKLSNYSTISLNGQRNVLKKLIVDATFGGMNTYDYAFVEEAINVSGLSIKLVDFQIRDVNSNIIDLNGSHVSFACIFVPL